MRPEASINAREFKKKNPEETGRRRKMKKTGKETADGRPNEPDPADRETRKKEKI